MTRQSLKRRRRQEAALRAWIETGSPKAAAHRLGVTEGHVRRLVASYCEEQGYASAVQAAAYYVQSDELRV